MPKDNLQESREKINFAQVKDDLVCVNRVANIEGGLKLVHLRIVTLLIQSLQPALKHKITFRRVSGSVPESLLPPKARLTLEGYCRKITIPVSEFGLGLRNGGRLRQYLCELQCCHIGVISAKGNSALKPLVAGFDYPQFSRNVDVFISESVLRSLLATEEGYFTFSKSMAFSVSNRYTLRIYWLVSSWKQKGGFAITVDRFCRLLNLGSAYERMDNLTLKIIQPAHVELKDKFPVYFEFRIHVAETKYLVFKVKTMKSAAEINTDFQTARDTVFELLMSVGASVTLLSDMLLSIDHEDLLPFLHKLSNIVSYARSQKGLRTIQDIDAYILTSMTAWHSDWLSRYSITE